MRSLRGRNKRAGFVFDRFSRSPKLREQTKRKRNRRKRTPLLRIILAPCKPSLALRRKVYSFVHLFNNTVSPFRAITRAKKIHNEALTSHWYRLTTLLVKATKTRLQELVTNCIGLKDHKKKKKNTCFL